MKIIQKSACTKISMDSQEIHFENNRKWKQRFSVFKFDCAGEREPAKPYMILAEILFYSD